MSERNEDCVCACACIDAYVWECVRERRQRERDAWSFSHAASIIAHQSSKTI